MVLVVGTCRIETAMLQSSRQKVTLNVYVYAVMCILKANTLCRYSVTHKTVNTKLNFQTNFPALVMIAL